MATNLDSSVFPHTAPTVPKLVPVFIFNLKVTPDPEPVFSDSASDKALTLARVVNGEVKTIADNGIGELDITNVTGFDDLTTKLSANTTRLDCKLYGKTAGGAGVYIRYPGVVQMLKPTTDVLSRATSSSEFDEGYVTCNPSFEFDGSVEDKYKWVLKENFVAKGRFVRDGEGGLYVQYYVYALR
ncbi:hypothetical protein DICA3_E21308 [Diutina catenulata]